MPILSGAGLWKLLSIRNIHDATVRRPRYVTEARFHHTRVFVDYNALEHYEIVIFGPADTPNDSERERES